jgi:hypothetical protein
MNYPALKVKLGPQFGFITGFRADSSRWELRLEPGKVVDTGTPGGFPPLSRVGERWVGEK